MDIDFDHRAIMVRNDKGAKDRVVTLADELVLPLQRHMANVKSLFEGDLAAGYGCVYLPHALARKYPIACKEWKWQYVFPATQLSRDPRSGIKRRHHIDASTIPPCVSIVVRSPR